MKAPILATCTLLAALASPAAAQDPLLEVRNADDTKLMQVNEDGGLLALGIGRGAIPATGEGERFMWYAEHAAVRGGGVSGDQWDEANVGRWSAAFGLGPVARGFASFAAGTNTLAAADASIALGRETQASGSGAFAAGSGAKATADVSTALGFQTEAGGTASFAVGDNAKAPAPVGMALGQLTTASGFAAVALGASTTASGPASLATGRNTVASGNVATALGAETVASGEFSTAIGHNAVASARGSFAFGDASSTGNVAAIVPNQFVARAAGGFRFLTNANLITGCDINDGNMTCTGTVNGSSSAALKHDFVPVDPESVLQKVSGLNIQSWRYLADTAEIRHVGPTSEDFRDAFGLGASERTIAMVDADGVNLLAVQALARRTVELRQEVVALRDELHALLTLMGRAQ